MLWRSCPSPPSRMQVGKGLTLSAFEKIEVSRTSRGKAPILSRRMKGDIGVSCQMLREMSP